LPDFGWVTWNLNCVYPQRYPLVSLRGVLPSAKAQDMFCDEAISCRLIKGLRRQKAPRNDRL